MVRYQTRALLAFAVALALTCIIFSIWVWANVYAGKKGIGGKIPDDSYPGVAIFLQCTFVFTSSFVLRLGRVNDDYM